MIQFRIGGQNKARILRQETQRVLGYKLSWDAFLN